MIFVSWQGLDNALHLKREERGVQYVSRQTGMHGKDISLAIAMLLQCVNDRLFVGCKVSKHAAADASLARLFQFDVVLPVHGVHDILRRGYQLGLVVAYEVVAALAVFRIDRTGDGKYLATVVLCYAGSYQSAAV